MTRKSLKSDAKARHDKLCELILTSMETEGQDHDGRRWIVRPCAEWAAALGVDRKTVSRLIQHPPIQRLDTGALDASGKWKRVTALRLALPGEPPLAPGPKHIAHKMQKLFVAKTGRTPGKMEYGCMIGLAELWPAGYQVAIFTHLLAEWGWYAAAIKARIEFERDALGVTGLVARYYRFPSIRVLRRWPHVVADAYLTDWQLKYSGKINAPLQPFGYHYSDDDAAAAA